MQNTQSISCSTPMPRRHFVVAGLAAAFGGLTTLPTHSKAVWPERPITLIVPWPAGGATDLSLRIMAEEASAILGQPVTIVNKPGAAGTLVAPLLKTAQADGYTIGQVPLTVYRHALMNKVAWDPVADMTPILQLSGTTFGLLVPASSPWQHAKEMLLWAQNNPGALTLGSTGIGSTPHLAMEEILDKLKAPYIHVPYKGTTDQMLALAKAEVMAGVNSTGFAPWVKEGKLRLLAVFSAQRQGQWPNVPTMRELGYSDAVYTSAWGLAAPAGSPSTAIQALHDAFKKALYTQRNIDLLRSYDQEIEYLDSAAYAKAIQDGIQKEKKLLSRMGLLAK